MILERPAIETILVSPKGGQVIADSRTIQFPALTDWPRVPSEHARLKVGKPDCLWNPKMDETIKAWKAGETVDLASCGFQVRIGTVAGLLTNRGLILLQFGPTHPTRPYFITPPAGIWEGGSILDSALRELGEEVIINRKGQIGFWTYKGRILAQKWVRDFAKFHGFEIDPRLRLEIDLDNRPYPGLISVRFGRGRRLSVFVAFEPDTGGIELIVPLKAKKPIPTEVELLDGERSKTGIYYGRQVLYGLFTTKAEALLHGHGI